MKEFLAYLIIIVSAIIVTISLAYIAVLLDINTAIFGFFYSIFIIVFVWSLCWIFRRWLYNEPSD